MDPLEVYYRSEYTANHQQMEAFRPASSPVRLASLQVSDGWQVEMLTRQDLPEIRISKDSKLVQEYDDLDLMIPKDAFAMRQMLTSFLVPCRNGSLDDDFQEMPQADCQFYMEFLSGWRMPCETSTDYTCCLERSDGWTAMTGAHRRSTICRI